MDVFDEMWDPARVVADAGLLAVEIRSPGDESVDKLRFYERVGLLELVMIDRDTKEVRHWPQGRRPGRG